jgi:hypothetical protein
MLMSVRPVAVQMGQTAEVDVSARYSLHGASQVFVSGAGVTGEIASPAEQKSESPKGKRRNVNTIKLRFKVAPDVVPGVRDFRIITPQGASTIGQLVLTRDPVFVESGDNNSPAKAQAVTLPVSVCGAIESAEDVDYFKFKAEAGSAITFHVRARRLEHRYHDLQVQLDPILTLRNAAGATLAASDNYYGGDPLLHHSFDQAGEYLLEIRDVRYQGNTSWGYCIEVNDRPFVTQVFPAAVAAGSPVKLSPVGFRLAGDAAAEVHVPAGAAAGVASVSPIVGGRPVNDVGIVVSPLPMVLEAAEMKPGAAMPAIAVPAVINGRIEAPGDVDAYLFEAKPGEAFSFEVLARRIQSELDSNLRILNAQGAVLAEVDDLQLHRTGYADSWLENWTAPAAGKYTIEIRDLHLRGGPQFTYAISVTRSQPYFTLETDTDKTLLAPGMAAPIYVRVVRKNGFAGEVQLAVEGLPPGVTATCGRILAGGNDGCIILRAAANAAAGAANLRITGAATHALQDGTKLNLAAVATPLQEYYSPGGGRGHYPVEMHTVSVADPMDIRAVKLSATTVNLAPGGAQRIDVTLERAPGFKGNVSLDVLYQHLEQPFGVSLPKGVTLDAAHSKTLLTGEETNGHITLKAAADAPAVDKQLVPVMAHVSVNFVMKMTYCGDPVFVSVTPAK